MKRIDVRQVSHRQEQRSVRRIIRRRTSDDGSSAEIEVQSNGVTTVLAIDKADLPSLSAAALSAYSDCRRLSNNPGELNALPAEGILVEEDAQSRYSIVTVTLLGGQQIAFLLPKPAS